jgi:hypothetical protein
VELKPVGTNELINYQTGRKEKFKHFSINDLMINHEFATPHAGFALRFLNDKSNGYFVEIGACHWKENNNTYLLEKEFNWNGVAIDIEKHFADEYNFNRKNFCIHGDGMSFNWDKYFQENNFPKRIDFLQIDIDKTPKYANLFALLNMPLARYRFSTMAIEHCANIDPSLSRMREIQREILFSYGYMLVASGYDEDWWIDSELGISESEYNSISRDTWVGKFI